MKAREAQERMHGLEDHGEDWTTAQFMAWLLQLDVDDMTPVIREELDRTLDLCQEHYTHVGTGAVMMAPYALVLIGFQQGATFAAAALDRMTRQEEMDER